MDFQLKHVHNFLEMVIEAKQMAEEFEAYAFIFFAGLVGNFLVALYIFKLPKIKSVTVLFICNLVIAHIIVLAGLPLYVLHLLGFGFDWMLFGSALCHASYITVGTMDLVVPWFLLVLLFDRYLALSSSIFVKRCRSTQIGKWIPLLVWLVFAPLILPLVLHAKTDCYPIWPYHGNQYFSYYRNLVGFALPLVIFCVLCVLIIRQVQIPDSKNSEMDSGFSAKKRLVDVIIKMIAAHFLLSFPARLILMFHYVQLYSVMGFENLRILFNLTDCMSYLIFAINPFIYGWIVKTSNTLETEELENGEGEHVQVAMSPLVETDL